MNKKSIFFILFIVAGFGLIRLYYNLTDDFRLTNISYDLPNRKEWDINPLSNVEKADLTRILNQKFKYLGKGAQVYAFVSEDGCWVIKFFKFKHLKPSLFVDLLPSIPPLDSFKKSTSARKLKKIESIFEGYRLAYLFDRHHAGLAYIHLNKTNHLNLTAHLVDKLGLEREVALDSTVFVVQRKGKTLRSVFSELLNQNRLADAQNRANQILDMYVAEYQAGIWDRDHGVTHNTGFIGDRPLHLDVGKISYSEEMKKKEHFKPDILFVGYKICSWIQAHFPNHHADILTSVEKHLSEILNENVHVQNRA